MISAFTRDTEHRVREATKPRRRVARDRVDCVLDRYGTSEPWVDKVGSCRLSGHCRSFGSWIRVAALQICEAAKNASDVGEGSRGKR